MQIIEITLVSNAMTVYAEKSLEVKRGDTVVVDFDNSIELGIVKGEANEESNASLIRIANLEDKKAKCENCKEAKSLIAPIKEEASKLGLEMKIGHIAFNLDKTKMTVIYTSENRVDFRELVKILGSKYKMRIEMRQIGNRDETKIVGALGTCGRVVCCNSFLNDFDKVSIKMAKNQNIALNPNRINGMCGRLLCCLKYEDEYYEEMQKKMPKVGFIISTPDGKGKVTSVDYLRETVTVSITKDESEETKVYPIEELNYTPKEK